MDILTLKFNKKQAQAVIVAAQDQLDAAIDLLGLGSKPVVVVVGGAGGIDAADWPAINRAVETVASIAEQAGAAIIDGGTDSGVMAALGQIRTGKNYSFPLLGMAAEGTVTWPGKEKGLLKRLFKPSELGKLDANHTHFIFVPGKNWGDESNWIATTATKLAGEHLSVAVLINGGRISRDMDIPNNLEAGRPVIIVEGTGRAADDRATLPPNTRLMSFIHISESESLKARLMECLGMKVDS